MPPKPDLVFNNAPNDVETVHTAFNVKISPIKPKIALSHHRPSAPIIEDWVSDSEDESETNTPQNVSSFVQPTEQIKSLRPSVQHVKTSVPPVNSKTAILKPTSNGKRRNRKTCFVCRSLDYLIKDCDYHEKKMAQPTARNHAKGGNHKQYASMTFLNPYRPRQAKTVVTKPNSPHRRHINRSPSPKANNFPPKVTAVKAPMVNVAQGTQGKWEWKPKCPILDHVSRNTSASMTLKRFDYNDALGRSKSDKGVIDSGCSRHMTGNMSYLSDFEELNGGYVAFGGNPKGGKISRKATKDETSPILKTFITGLENQLSLKVKIIKSDNGTEFKNDELNQFCGMEGIKREFSVPRTPQQNGIAERKNKTLIEAARTMLADLLLPILFWAEAVNTACYVQNRVLVTKPQNKTPYELLHGRTPSIGFMRPFGCLVTILNTLDSLETLHIYFLENKPNVASSGPTWLFDINTLTKTMNYQPVTAGNQSNPIACVQEQFDVEKAGEESDQQYVLFPVWSSGSTNPQNTDGDVAFDEKEPEFERRKHESEVNVSPSSSALSKKHDDKTKKEAKGKSLVESLTGYRNLSAEFKDLSDNSINEDNAAGTLVPAVGQLSPNNTNTFSAAGPSNVAASPTPGKSSYYAGAEADFNNLETTITVSLIPTTRVQKDLPVTQIIGDLSLATQTRSMTRVAKDQGGLSWINNDDFYTCMFGCFFLQKEPKRVHQALKELSWIEVIQEELLQFKMQKVWVLVDLPHGKRAIDGKSASTPIDTEKPLLKDPDGVNIPRCDEDRLELMELTIFLLLSDEKVGVEFSAVDLQVFVVRLILLLLVQKFLLFGLTNWCCSLNAVRSQRFNQIIDFLNGSSIKYALTVNPNIYVSCIKQFWTSVVVKKVNDVTRFQALVDKKKVIITEAIIRDALRLDDAEVIECLPNEEIFIELARMGYEKPSTKLTFYKAFFLRQWKFLIHTILQCMSAKRMSWNEFSSSMASAVICLSTGRKFNFSKYIFDSLERNVDSLTKFYMYPRFLQLMIRAQVGDLFSHTTKYSSPALTHKVFANMKRVGKGCSEVETPLFKGMRVEQQVGEDVDDVHVYDVSTVGVAAEGVVSATDDVVPAAIDEPSIPSLTPPTEPQPPSQDIPSTSQDAEISIDLLQNLLDTCTTLTRRVEHLEQDKVAQALDITKLKQRGRMIADMDTDVDVILEDAKEVVVEKSVDVLSMQDDEVKPAELQEVVEVVTTAKLITEVVTIASATITAVAPQLTTVAAPTFTTAPSAARRRKGVVIRDPQETATPSTIIHSKAKSKDKGKGILRKQKEENVVKRYQALKRKPQKKVQAMKNMMIYLRNVVGFKMDYFKGMTYDDIRLIFKKKFNSNNLDEEVEELKRHLQIVPNDEDDVYTEATPLALKVPVVDYEIYTEKNKPYYKIKRADGSPQLYLSFLSMLRNFDREDLEVIWRLVKERFAFTKPKNFSNDFLLTTLGAMFEKLDIQAQIWKNQRIVHCQAKVKS
nr:hypothetical protein [Tanacetum cinerariifolium]